MLRRTIAIVGFVGLAASCAAEPDIVEASASTAEPEVAIDVPVEPPPLEEPVLEKANAISIASDFVDELRSANETGDFASAVRAWSGYPDIEDARAGHLLSLITMHPWLLDGELGFETLDSWAFEPQWAMTIVVITNPERTATTTKR